MVDRAAQKANESRVGESNSASMPYKVAVQFLHSPMMHHLCRESDCVVVIQTQSEAQAEYRPELTNDMIDQIIPSDRHARNIAVVPKKS